MNYPALSGKRDSDPRPLAWEANALPTELFPHKNLNYLKERQSIYFMSLSGDLFDSIYGIS